MKSIRKNLVWVVSGLLIAAHVAVRANNLQVSNVTLADSEKGYTHVTCDVNWDNSWRASWTEIVPSITVTNWDAAWVFVKFRVATNNAPWQHATLSTNSSDHIVPSQALFTVGTSSNAVSANLGVGGFLYRKDEGSGNWSNSIKLRWNYSQDGVASTDKVDVSVQAIEMVYVPQGAFNLGSTGTEGNRFYQYTDGSQATNTYLVSSENAITISTNTAGDLNFNSNTKVISIPSSFPKGYNAFYCMKYEVSQGQYVNFFNMLTAPQKTNHNLTASTDGKNTQAELNRNTFSWAGGVSDASITNSAGLPVPDRACNWLKWTDLAAYADWAGLRPMTELEFEKACRGVAKPVKNEFAWGNDAYVFLTAEVAGDTGTSTVSTAGANFSYGAIAPTRCGIFATATSGRVQSGASYWGIMELSGNVWEFAVTAATANGLSFPGTHGDGGLAADGYANVSLWPGSNAKGTGFRGGFFGAGTVIYRTSDRSGAQAEYYTRNQSYGGRVVRLAP